MITILEYWFTNNVCYNISSFGNRLPISSSKISFEHSRLVLNTILIFNCFLDGFVQLIYFRILFILKRQHRLTLIKSVHWMILYPILLKSINFSTSCTSRLGISQYLCQGNAALLSCT